MEFIRGLPKTSTNHDVIWIIVDQLTKIAHFLTIKTTDLTMRLARLFVEEIVRLHGIPTSVVSDKDPHFALHFWDSI